MSVASYPSLRQSEARERAELLTVRSYEVRLDLREAETAETFGSVTTVRFESAGGRTFVDVKAVAVHAVRLDGQPLDPAAVEHGRLALDVPAGEHELVVDAAMPYRNDGEGMHRHRDPADGRTYLYVMSFMDAAPSVWACFDQPDLKAPYTMHVTAPDGWTVVGNAPATAPSSDDGAWSLGPTQPLSTYFVTLVAGPYHVLRDEHDGIGLGLSSRQALAPHLDKDAEELFTLTRQCFDEFHRLFGIRYPFGEYHQAFVPEFNAGAMENPGCVTFRDQLVFDTRVTRGVRISRASTVAHEMAHQWFGNIVTPVWWDDLWLNESFAEYMGNRLTADVTQYDDAWEQVAWARRQWGLTADARPSTHPVAGNGAADAQAALQNFDGISYAKGSSVLKQLCTRLGDDVFFAGVVDHLTTHRFGNATMHDLFASWERAGAGDLADVVDQWLRTAGADVVRLDRAAGVLHRTAPADHPAERTHRFDLAVLRGGEVATSTVTLADAATPLDGAAPPDDAAVVLDPWEQSWGVYVPDAVTLGALRDELPRVTDPLLRAAAWNNVKSGYRQLAVDPDLVVDLAVAALPAHDTDGHTRPWLLGEVVPAASPGAAERLLGAALELTASAEPAGELQLSAFRTAVLLCRDPDRLRGWLAQAPDGVEVDLDVRWRLLVQLAALGAVDVPELDAELAREVSSVAHLGHVTALASLPTEQAKERAWRLFTGADDAANHDVDAAGQGFWRDGQAELVRPYVERYVADLPATADVRAGWLLALAARAFFPRTMADDDALARLRDLRDGDALVPAVRRAVADQVSDLEHRLAVRRAFPKPPSRPLPGPGAS